MGKCYRKSSYYFFMLYHFPLVDVFLFAHFLFLNVGITFSRLLLKKNKITASLVVMSHIINFILNINSFKLINNLKLKVNNKVKLTLKKILKLCECY